MSRYLHLIGLTLTDLDLEETGRAKRRITGQGYNFKLLKSPIAPLSLQGQPASRAVSSPTAILPKHDQNGIPSVRTTAPGDEIADFAKFRQKQQVPQVPSNLSTTVDNSNADVSAKAEGPSRATKSTNVPKDARRFHLTRDLSSSYNPSKPTGIRKNASRSSSIRPPMPTFVERHPHDELYAKPPVDKILHDQGKPTEMSSAKDSEEPPKDAVPVATFTKPNTALHKSGVSINDPAVTWNRDSDQLADELAALAMELDPDIEPQSSAPRTTRSPEPSAQASAPIPDSAPIEEDYIYETYVRMTDDTDEANPLMSDASVMNVGVLVIDEEDEDMWEGYMRSDDDTDEDDEDSNGK